MAVSVGHRHSSALGPGGAIECWGYDFKQQVASMDAVRVRVAVAGSGGTGPFTAWKRADRPSEGMAAPTGLSAVCAADGEMEITWSVAPSAMCWTRAKTPGWAGTTARQRSAKPMASGGPALAPSIGQSTWASRSTTSEVLEANGCTTVIEHRVDHCVETVG